eukprot:9090040-Pyramimonas_sp.AAC.1
MTPAAIAWWTRSRRSRMPRPSSPSRSSSWRGSRRNGPGVSGRGARSAVVGCVDGGYRPAAGFGQGAA